MVELILQAELISKNSAKIVSDLRRWTILRISASAIYHGSNILSDLREHGSNPVCLSNLAELLTCGVIFKSRPDNIKHFLWLSTADIPMSSGRTEIIEQG